MVATRQLAVVLAVQLPSTILVLYMVVEVVVDSEPSVDLLVVVVVLVVVVL